MLEVTQLLIGWKSLVPRFYRNRVWCHLSNSRGMRIGWIITIASNTLNTRTQTNKVWSVCSKIFKDGGLRQGKVDRLFSALVLPNFSYGLSAYCAEDLDLTFIQNFRDRCFKRKDTSKRMDIRDLLSHAQSFLIGYLVTLFRRKNKQSIIFETELSSARK